MCGFVLAMNLDGAPVDPRALVAAADIQRHRGPDDNGFLLTSLGGTEALTFSPDALPVGAGHAIGLGFNRLSIIDLSAAGHQPMGSDDGLCFIVYNGEIYNFAVLRAELEADGVRFRGHSDTEVILRYYERHGIAATLAALNGMFAFAIVDLRQGVVHVARDRFGVKPLYVGRHGQAIVFASEIKSILAFPGFEAKLARDNLDEFLLFRYVADTRTMFEGIDQVRPGTYLTIRDGSVGSSTYWSFPAQADRGADPDRIEAWLEDSVRRQLIADVPVGCQLSGGIDSTLVNLLARGAAGHRLEAFSVIFDDAAYSEEPWIDEAAARADVALHKYTFDSGYFADNFARAAWHLEAPLNHPNSIGLYLLTENAARSVKVLLSGEGADETMGGYPRFFYSRARQTFRPALPLTRLSPRLHRRLIGSVSGAASDDLAWFVNASAFTTPAHAAALLPDFDAERAVRLRREQIAAAEGDTLSRCLNYEATTYLPELLIRQDKMTMAHSVENRVPFLDNEMVANVRSLASKSLVGARLHRRGTIARNTKIGLKSAANRHFGEDFVYRTKAGFGIPLHTMFAHPRMREQVGDAILPGIRSRGLFDASRVESLWNRSESLGSEDMNLLWTAISFETWAGLYLGGKALTRP
jgi:asparagine synthase (glutamine-hydrolysing)